MRSEHYWERLRLGLLIVFIGIIIFNIFSVYQNYLDVQRGVDLSASEEAYDIKGEYLHDKNVLVISSYTPTYMIVPEEEDGIYDTLKEAAIGYEIEYMNSKELGADPDHEQEFYTTIRKHVDYHKKAGSPYAAIMAGDDDALHFCMKYKDELFADTPIVFYAVNDIAYAKECVKDPMVAGSIERTYMEETIDLAQGLIPDADQIIMIRDNTPTSVGDWERLQSIQNKYPGMKISDINTEEMSTQRFCDRSGKLNDHSIVLMSVALKDGDGKMMSLLQRCNMIGEYANEPVFSCYMHGIGTGCTAGDAMYMRDCGENAAKMVVQILNRGVKPSEIKMQAEGFHRIAIDEKMMNKYGLKLDNVPEDALVLNRTETFWTTYRAVLKPMIWIILSLICILILILIDAYYVRKAKREVEHQNNILDALSYEYVSLWYLDVETRRFSLLRYYGKTETEKQALGKTSANDQYDLAMKTFAETFVYEEDREHFIEKTAIENILKESSDQDIYTVNFRLLDLNGNTTYCMVSYAKTVSLDGSTHFVYGFHNIDDETREEIRKQQELELAWRNAHIDNMTGMMNRRSFEEKIQELSEKGMPDELSVAVLDVNNLKKANDSLGHQAGDELICGLAECLREATARSEFENIGFHAFRTGGDEFVVLANASDARFDRICEESQRNVQAWKGETIKSLKVSFGRASRSEFPDASIQELIQTADDRMYQAKREAHRNEFEHADDYNEIENFFSADSDRDETELLKTALSAFKAESDQTTGLPGMYYFKNAIYVLNREIISHGGTTAVVCLRFQHLSKYNERYGVQAGNELIAQLADQLIKTFGKKNCARSGGNEIFICTAAETLEARLIEVIQRMHQICEDKDINIRAGICLCSEEKDRRAEEVCEGARIACARDSSGPDTVFEYYEAEM